MSAGFSQAISNNSGGDEATFRDVERSVLRYGAAMAIDPVTSLAFAIQSQPGVYSALIGSGVSRSANIPTGWGITNELIRRLALAEGDTIAIESEDWYREKYDAPVGFSTLLSQLAPTQSDRRALLASFIEPAPDSDDRRPTAAHRALADLASAGQVKVFITTNFDRLLEQSLTDRGIHPLVIHDNAGARGAQAFHHAGVVVFKIHGDYQDPASMRVTEDELSSYPRDLAQRLARVLEDYGLIAVGWSGEYDPALRTLMSANRSRRYPLYYAARRGRLADAARTLVSARSGIVVPITDADTFLPALHRRVTSIATSAEPHPLDIRGLVGATKSAITNRSHPAVLEDVLTAETERAVAGLEDDEAFPTHGMTDDYAGHLNYVEQARRTANAVLGLAHMFAIGAAYWNDEYSDVWSRSLGRLGQLDKPQSGVIALLALRRLPPVVVLYASTIAAVARDTLGTVKTLALDTHVASTPGPPAPLAARSNVFYPFERADPRLLTLLVEAEVSGDLPSEARFQELARGDTRRTGASDYLHVLLRKPLESVIPSDDDYDRFFDRAEALLGLINTDLQLTASDEPMAPYIAHPGPARYMWRDSDLPFRIVNEIAANSAPSSLLTSGLFGGSESRLSAAADAYAEHARQLSIRI